MNARLLLTIGFVVYSMQARTQGLEDVYVERYQVPNPEEISSSNGFLNQNSRTFRIYADLAEGYRLQAVFGNEAHPLELRTTTSFFNERTEGNRSADRIEHKSAIKDLVRLDSWLSMGHADKTHIACPLIINQNGFLEGVLPSLFSMGMDWTATSHTERFGFMVNDGTWFMLEGVKGATEENMVLIAQLTTDGQLNFNLNFQIIAPNGSIERYVANDTGDGATLSRALNSEYNQSAALINE